MARPTKLPSGGTRPSASCHPARLHYAKGNCRSCYESAKYAASPELRARQKVRSRKGYETNRERRRPQRNANERAYYARNRERISAVSRKRNAATREQVAARNKAYYALHRERLIQRSSETTAARRKGMVIVERVSRANVLTAHSGLCGICHERVDPARWHLDHIVPISRGGVHSYANVQPTHPFCNLSKNNRC